MAKLVDATGLEPVTLTVCRFKSGFPYQKYNGVVVKLVNTKNSKFFALKACRFESDLPHQILKDIEMKCDISNFSKLDIRNNIIYYFIYQQDGSKQLMTLPDTTSNRLFVSWVQIHDRYK